jgi:DNA-binding CsgD family transcriptional regulator
MFQSQPKQSGPSPKSSNLQLPELLKLHCDGFRLTEREQQALYCLARGQTEKAAADSMGCSPKTVKFHSKNFRRKIHAPNTAAAIAKLWLGLSLHTA